MRPSLPVIVTVLPPPAGFVPPNDMQDLLNTIPTYLDIELDDSGPAFSIGAAPPATDTGGLYIHVPTPPSPPRARTYVPSVAYWEQIYTGQPDEVRMLVQDTSGDFDSTGLAIMGTDWYGWALCNGNNGTINLQNKFVVAGYDYNETTGYWVTNIGSQQDSGGGQTGGSAQVGTTPIDLSNGGFVNFQINLWNLPLLNVFVPYNGEYASGGNTLGAPIGPGTGDQEITIPFTNQAQMVGALISRIPHFVAVGYVQFVGY